MNFLVGIFVDKILKYIITFLVDWVQEYNAKKDAKDEIKKIMQVSDAQERASLLDNYLGTGRMQ